MKKILERMRNERLDREDYTRTMEREYKRMMEECKKPTKVAGTNSIANK